jgi:predicted GNAT superfamily acetyltransferase
VGVTLSTPTGVSIRQLRSDDFEPIVAVADDWWGRPVGPLFHRLFFDHFSSTSFVAEQQGRLVGFLIGFLSPSQAEVGYCHLIAVDATQRGQGVGRRLYDAFFELALRDGRSEIRAITSPTNGPSIAFHRSLGFTVEPGDGEKFGIPVHRGYSWDGTPRVVLVKTLRERLQSGGLMRLPNRTDPSVA